MLRQRVMWSRETNWFFDNPTARKMYEMAAALSIKFGGWSHWIQGAQGGEGERFIFPISSDEKDRAMFGDAGNIYFLEGLQGWPMCGDC